MAPPSPPVVVAVPLPSAVVPLSAVVVGDANDVVAEVFTVAWRKIGQMPDGAETLPWLYGVARNEVLKAQRRSGRWGRLRERLGREPRYPDLGPEPVVVRNAESEQLMKALATHPNVGRCVVLGPGNALVAEIGAELEKVGRPWAGL